jgi:hypothetical protein
MHLFREGTLQATWSNSNHMFMLINLTAVYTDTYCTSIFAGITIKYGTTLNFTFDPTFCLLERKKIIAMQLCVLNAAQDKCLFF